MKRSALYTVHRRAGANFADYFGWELPSSFVPAEQEAAHICASAGLADFSYFLKFDLRSQPEQKSWRLASKHYLVVSEPSVAAPAGAIDITSVYAAFRLAGPKSAQILGKLTSLNVSDKSLSNLGCAQASLAHVPGIFLRDDIGSIPGFHLLVTRDYAESAWEAILQAGHEYHLAPSGVEAFQFLKN